MATQHSIKNKTNGAEATDSTLLHRYRAAFTQSRDAILFFQHGRIFDCNPAFLALFRIPHRKQLAKLDIDNLSPFKQPNGQRSDIAGNIRIKRALNTGQAFFDWQMRDLGGREFPAEVMLYRLDLPEGRVLQATVRDISERQAQRQALLQREQDLLEAQRIACLGNWISDFERSEIRWCEQIYQMFGRPQGEHITHAIFMQAVHPDDRDHVQTAFDAAMRGAPYDIVHRVVHPDGRVRTVHARGQIEFSPDGQARRMIGTVQDITEQKRLEAELAHSAITDHLTGAFNRKRFDEEIEKALARLRRNGVSTALILLDIDHFKPVNDTHGHDVGDQVLVELTHLIQESLRVPDLLARWGGEEFVLLLPDTGLSEAYYLAERLRQLIASHCFTVVRTITASLSLTTLQSTDCPHSCMKRLDEALYQAKHAGRNQVIEAPPIVSVCNQPH
ncbi:sensor domain-containing diguanylate cyclase [Halomonas llamarensis]|uniref:diguanylate cyclase n=1 Tax=Halomonas llamarensis TaxID=2945104 RepID=A0ABT0SN48_9GAMM|nr:diguanylate cyclase [Halomonas llamarensis]MCL7929228.1 diguanylate cyclase [Halomonas llamarensis]